MSTFRDFQLAWVRRFPNCDLPKAWEEDVRSNLDRHRAKVTELKGELEKEEFYVEYLERLLADVEKGRTSSSSDVNSNLPSNGIVPKASPRTSTTSANTACNNNNVNDAGNGKSNNNISSQGNHCTTASASKSSNRDARNGSIDSSHGGCNPSGDQYVTVISVSSGDRGKETSESPISHLQRQSSTRSSKEYETSVATNRPKEPVARTSINKSGAVKNGAVVILTKTVSNASNKEQDDTSKKKKRPPTPPRKPKINPQNFPGLQFMGKDGFGNADNLSSPSNSMPSTPVDTLDPHGIPSVTSVTSTSLEPTPLITESKTIDFLKFLSAQRGRSAATESIVQQMITAISSSAASNAATTAAAAAAAAAAAPAPATSSTSASESAEGSALWHILRMRYESEHGSNHSLASADSDLQLDARDDLCKSDEGSLNEHLSAHGLPENQDADDMQEGIYDTVAPDIDDASAPDHILLDCKVPLDKCANLLGDDRQSSGSNLSFTGATSSLLPNNHSSNDSNFANYVNIDYFLRRDETSSKNDSDDNETNLSRSLSSDRDLDEEAKSLNRDHGSKCQLSTSLDSSNQCTYDEVFHDPDLYGAYYGVAESDPLSIPFQKPVSSESQGKSDAECQAMHKCIIDNMIESETYYVDCLNTLVQYMKAIKSTIGTTSPLISPEDLSTIFYKIPDLHTIHCQFLDGLKLLSNPEKSSNESNERIYGDPQSLGDLFKNLASRLSAYSAYLKNYSRALEAVQRCNSENNQFSEVTRAIKIKSTNGPTVTLEELLHKPVARVQKNALLLQDLLKHTPSTNSDYASLKTASEMTQCFLNDLNIAATEQMFPVQDKTQRRLVKESFIIESVEGKRKLRHLFLFNDIIVCAKYKASTRQKFTFDVKWFASLADVCLPEKTDDTSSVTIKERETQAEIMSLKSRVSSLRDLANKEGKSTKGNAKALEKYRKKQLDLETQLVLLLPQLTFAISTKSGKNYSFFLSSEHEKIQWTHSIKVLQQTLPASSSSDTTTVNLNELQAWIETCRKGLNPNLGSFLLRSTKDEDLLHGDLYIEILSLQRLSRPADLFFVLEVDVYGHFFQKATTKTARESTVLHYDQEFVIDLDGSQTLRILCYENVPGHTVPLFRGKTQLDLSRSWLTDQFTGKDLPILDSTLSVKVKFVSSEASTIRFPAGKVYGTFGCNIQTVCKKERSQIPYLIVGCVREVERRGLKEQGVYRVSGLNSDLQKLKRAFENNPYEAEHLLKDIDIHAVTGLLKMYLRELPEALFTNALYKKFFDAFKLQSNDEKKKKFLSLFTQLPQVNQNTINFLIDHLANVNQHKQFNKMTLQNLATVFGPTMIRPAASTVGTNTADQFTAGTIDVMAQAGILYFFLLRKVDPDLTSAPNSM